MCQGQENLYLVVMSNISILHPFMFACALISKLFNSSFYIGDNSALSQNDAYSELTKLLFLHSPTISDGCCSVCVEAYATCIIVITVLI